MSEYIIGQELDNYVYIFIKNILPTEVHNIRSIINKYYTFTYKYITVDYPFYLIIKLELVNGKKFIDFLREFIIKLRTESSFNGIDIVPLYFSKDKKYQYAVRYPGGVSSDNESVLQIEEITIFAEEQHVIIKVDAKNIDYKYLENLYLFRRFIKEKN